MLRILTFGGISVAHPERELTGAVLQPRRLALLAVLSRANERGVSRERLLSLFWPDDEEERARKALTQAVYALRRDLGNDGTIVGTQELRLDAELITSDVGDFAQMLKRGRLAEAVALYKGPFLQGFHLVGAPAFERWADDERASLAHDHARVCERLAVAAENAKQMHEAVEHWRVLASVDPLNAAVALRYMKALEATGDRAGALSHARIYEALIAQELELPPDRAVVELAEQLRKAPANPVAPLSAIVQSQNENDNATGTNQLGAAQSTASAPMRERPSTDSNDTNTSASASANTSSDVNTSAADMSQSVAPATAADPTPTANRRASDNPNAESPKQKLSTTATHAAVRAAAKSGQRLAIFGMVLLAAAAIAAVVLQKSEGADISKLHVVDTKRVTFEETLELDPAVSPDGHMIAYAGGTEGSMRLYVRQLDGSNPVLISSSVPGDHRRPRWSRDGTRIVFQADRAIWMVPALGGSARVIIDAPTDTTLSAMYPAWSPDGASVAWVQDGNIMVRELDGKSALKITHLKDAHSLSWSPDGKFIAAATDNEGFVYGAKGAMRFAGSSIGNIAPGVIYTINALTGETARVTEINRLSTSPDWTKDSRSLVYVSNQDGARDLYAIGINESGERTGEPARLSTGLDAHTVSIASDGRTVAYTTFRQSANLWSIGVDDKSVASVKHADALTRGEQTIEAMDVSPNGKWIAFDSDRSGQQDIFRTRADGAGETERVVTSPTDDFHPMWSPDGKQIAFYRIRDGVRRGVVVDANGGNEQYVGPQGGSLEEHSPVWAANGRQLLFHRFNKETPDLYSITRSGDGAWSAPVRLTEHGGIWPTFSSDGKEFAYFSTAGEISVNTLGANESAKRVVVTKGVNGQTAMYARWIPGKRALMVRASDVRGNIGLWEVQVDTGAWRALVNFDDPRHPPIRPEFATDGRRAYFTLSDRTADVFTARLTNR